MGGLCSRVLNYRRKQLRAKRLREREERRKQRDTRMSAWNHVDGMPSIGNSMFVIDNPGVFADYYDVEDRLGEGSYAKVCFCRNRSTGASRAVKICSIERKKMRDMFYKELSYIKMLDHPNIVRLYEHFEDSKFLYMVLELCSGGELFDRLQQVGHFTEHQTAIIMQHVLQAVRHMHERTVCHRDLKIENWILRTDAPIENNRVKACDFNLATVVREGEEMSTRCGIPYFVAPQVLLGKYDKSCDIWSCGVLMYTLLCGYPPFFGKTDAEVLSRVRTGVYAFDHHDFATISEDCKEMIRCLLRYDPGQRLTAKQALNHRWIRLKVAEKLSPLKLKYLDNLRAYGTMGLLKKAALLAVANNLEEESTKPLIDTFMWLDDTGEGTINEEELRRGIARAGFTGDEVPADLTQIMSQADIDGGGDLNYSEFVAACLDYRVYTKDEVLWGAFRIFDRKGFGRIDPADLRELWGSAVTKDWCRAVIQDVAGEAATSIDFEGFTAMMKGKNIVGKKQLRKGVTKEFGKPKRKDSKRMSAKLAALMHDEEDRHQLIGVSTQELAVAVDEEAARAEAVEDEVPMSSQVREAENMREVAARASAPQEMDTDAAEASAEPSAQGKGGGSEDNARTLQLTLQGNTQEPQQSPAALPAGAQVAGRRRAPKEVRRPAPDKQAPAEIAEEAIP